MIEAVLIIALFWVTRRLRRASRELERPVVVHVHIHGSFEPDDDPGEEQPEVTVEIEDSSNVVPLWTRKHVA